MMKLLCYVIELAVMSIHGPTILLLPKQLLDKVICPIDVAASSIEIFQKAS